MTPREKPKKKKRKKQLKSENNENNTSPKPIIKDDNILEKRESPLRNEENSNDRNLKKSIENTDVERDKSLEQTSPREKNAISNSQQSRDAHPKTFQIRKRLTFKKNVKEPRWKLTAAELNQYGNRFPPDFHKLALLGKGGFSLVWKGEHKETKAQFAVKQLMKRHPGKSHLKEVFFGNYFFSNGEPKKKFLKYLGMNIMKKKVIRFLHRFLFIFFHIF